MFRRRILLSRPSVANLVAATLTFLYNTSKNTFPHFHPPLARGVRRGLVSRWAVKPACLVYIPIGEREFT